MLSTVRIYWVLSRGVVARVENGSLEAVDFCVCVQFCVCDLHKLLPFSPRRDPSVSGCQSLGTKPMHALVGGLILQFCLFLSFPPCRFEPKPSSPRGSRCSFRK